MIGVRAFLAVVVLVLAAVGVAAIVRDQVGWAECEEVCAPRRPKLSGTYACWCQGGHVGGWRMRPWVDTSEARWR